jgi:hypothetical protein
MTALINDSYLQTTGDLPSVVSQLTQSGVTPDVVHRTHERDVFVTSVRVVGPSHFTLTAQLPASHRFYGPTAGQHDPMLVLETLREAIFVVGHGKYDVPRDTSFVARAKEFEFYPAGLRAAGDEPVDISIDMVTTGIRRRGGAVVAMRCTMTCFRDGEPVGTASYDLSFASAPVYRRIRGVYKEAKPALAVDSTAVDPVLVGRTGPIDVLLGVEPGMRGWHLRVDPNHPVIFDHVIDHVPGNAAVEAGRQAAYLATGRPDATVLGGQMTFNRYIEFDKPCLVFAQQTRQFECRRTVVVGFQQGDVIMAEGTFELLLPRPTGA